MTYRPLLLIIALALASLAAVSCGRSEPEFNPADFDQFTTVPVELEVRSPAFDQGGTIPVLFTCDGGDEAPVISWNRPPNGTQSVAVIVDDPDAPGGIFTHWVVFNLPPEDNSLRGEIADGDRKADGPFEGINGFGERGYGGPCPPHGQTHEYRFSVYALTAPLALGEGATTEEVLTAMRGSVIGYGVLSATYTRP